MDLFVIAGISLIFILLGILFLIPTEKTAYRHIYKRSAAPLPEESKDWQAVSLKLEKHVLELRRQIDAQQKREKHLQRELAVEHDKYVKLQEKLSQERDWQKKEKDGVDRRNTEIIQLQKDRQEIEQNLEKEHSRRLMLEREMREAKDSMTAANDLKNSLEVQIAKLQAHVDKYRAEINELKQENLKLSKKHDETTFVAKSEYERVEKLLKDTQKEFAEFKAKINRETV